MKTIATFKVFAVFLWRLTIGLLVYIAFFNLLMTTNKQVIDEKGKIIFYSVSRFTGLHFTNDGDGTRVYGSKTWLNTLFYPVELAWKYVTL